MCESVFSFPKFKIVEMCSTAYLILLSSPCLVLLITRISAVNVPARLSCMFFGFFWFLWGGGWVFFFVSLNVSRVEV